MLESMKLPFRFLKPRPEFCAKIILDDGSEAIFAPPIARPADSTAFIRLSDDALEAEMQRRQYEFHRHCGRQALEKLKRALTPKDCRNCGAPGEMVCSYCGSKAA